MYLKEIKLFGFHLERNAFGYNVVRNRSKGSTSACHFMVTPFNTCEIDACSFKKNAWFVYRNCNLFPAKKGGKTKIIKMFIATYICEYA